MRFSLHKVIQLPVAMELKRGKRMEKTEKLS